MQPNAHMSDSFDLLFSSSISGLHHRMDPESIWYSEIGGLILRLLRAAVASNLIKTLSFGRKILLKMSRAR